ncbi:hypothetical protein BDV3_000915 [Batrachochytrium dendrobatidis]
MNSPLWVNNSQRVTLDATVKDYRKRFDPENVFNVPTTVDTLVDIPLYEAMQKMQSAKKELAMIQSEWALQEVAHRARTPHHMGIGIVSDNAIVGQEDGMTSIKSSIMQEYNNIHHENDADSGLSPLHIAARNNNVADIKLWIQSFSKNTLNIHDFTPLMVAASHNSLRALKVLLRMGVRKNDVDSVMQRTALHWAVIHEHHQVAKALLRFGADARFRDRDGRTPVHLAAMQPSPKCLQVMLKLVKPAAFLEGDNEQMTPIHLAVMNDNVRQLGMILAAHSPIDLTASDVEGKTALHWCAQNDVPQIYSPTIFHKPTTCIKLLIDNNPQLVKISDLEGRTPLHLACTVSNMSLIFAIFNQLLGTYALKDLVNAQDVLGRTAIHYSAIGGHAYILRVLQHYGGNDGIADKDGATPLHYACVKNHGQCVSVLISDNRLYENYIRDSQGRTPIMWAVLKGYAEALRILLEAGVDPNEEDDKKTTALHICALGGHSHCASLLLEHGASVDMQNSENRSPLFLATQHNHGQTANILIQNGANVNLLDMDRQSPLHWAALYGHLSIVSLLLSCQAEIDIVDKEGKTPFHCAAYNGHTKVLGFLAKNGAALEHKDNEGVSALHWATCGNYFDCVRMLLQLNVNPNIMDSDLLTPLDYAISVRSIECTEILNEYGGLTGDIISDVYAIRIQRAWKKYMKNKHKKSDATYNEPSVLGNTDGRYGSYSKLALGNRYMSMESIRKGSCDQVPFERRRQSLVTGRRISRDLGMVNREYAGASIDPLGGEPESAAAYKSSKWFKSKIGFPSRPTPIKAVVSRSRGALNTQTSCQKDIISESGEKLGKESIDIETMTEVKGSEKTMIPATSMSSFEMEYFQMEAAQRKLES